MESTTYFVSRKITDLILSFDASNPNPLKRLAKHDLTQRMIGDYRGDLATMKEALNSALEILERTLKGVSEGAGQVAAAAVESARAGEAG